MEIDKTKKTFIVMGNYRGGTTVVARLLSESGVYMGSENMGNHEDPNFQYIKPYPEDVQKMSTIVKDRNENYEYWGFKFPGNYKYIEKLIPWLIRPHYIIIMRDPVAIKDSELRRSSIDYSLSEIMSTQQEIFKVSERLAGPKLYLSYEYLLSKPFHSCRKLKEFTKLGDIEDLEKIITTYSDYGSTKWTYN